MENYSIVKIWKNLIVLITLLVAVAANVNLSNALPTEVQPTLYVEGATATYKGELIDVHVNIANLSKNKECIAAQFKLQYNKDLLQTQLEWVSEGPFFKSFGTTFFTAFVESNYVVVGVLLLPDESGVWSGPFPEGSGTIATITFKALYPDWLTSETSSAITLHDTILADANINTISHSVKDGSILFTFPKIFVSPASYVANRKGETFNINIDIENVGVGWNLTGAQFKLRYDTSMLQVVSVKEGPLLKSLGPTLFTAFVEYNYVLVGVLLLPDESGVWSGPFPEGSGTIATITFKALYQPTEPTSIVSSDLTLLDTIIITNKVEQIPHSLDHGKYYITAETFQPIEIQVEAGTIHFRGEIVDFYILVTDYGKPVDPEIMNAALHFDGEIYVDLSAEITRVSQGLYRVVFEIPQTAEAGTYTLLVNAEYIHAKGSAIRSFQVSPTLTGLNAYITEIRDATATIVIPSLNQIKVGLQALNGTLKDISDNIVTIETSIGTLKTDISNLNATLVSISGDVATIKTSLGTLKTDVSNLGVTVTKIEGDTATIKTSLGTLSGKVDTIQGDTATIKTDVGEIKVKVADLPGNVQTSVNLLYVILILALIAAVASIIVVIFMRKK
ncbi:MAG: cohesin domain-containing protein [Candidatus Bathyarchaeia archaeon]